MQSNSRSFAALRMARNKHLSGIYNSLLGLASEGTDQSLHPLESVPQRRLSESPADGRADYDARHRFTVAATYALPFAKNNALVGGWNLNTIVTLQTGTPFTVYDYSGKRADMVGNPNNGPKNSNKWFNTDAFRPAAGTQGTEPRNAVTGPPTRTVDLSVFKTVAVPGYGALELRLEGFNIFNWAQYNQPDNIVGGFNNDGTLNKNLNFGKITGTRLNSERQVQLGARYFF